MSDTSIPEIEEDPILKFELIIGDAGGRIDNGDVPVRWCASPDFIKELEEKGVKDPHVLITSNHNGGRDGYSYNREMDRKLIPIAELMTYVRFTRAGKCKVYGIVMDGSEGREALHKKWMRKHYGDYDDIINSYRDELYEDLDYAVVGTSEFVEIPEGVFGKEPSPWVKWYANLWHSNERVADECEFRKRVMIAFIFKWIPFLPFVTGWVILRVLHAGAFWLAGYFRQVDFLRAFRPYKYPSMAYNVMGDLNSLLHDNFFIFNRPDLTGRFEGRKQPMFFGLAFTPLLIVIVSAITLVSVDPNGVVGLAAIVGSFVGVVLGILLIFDILAVLVELALRNNTAERFFGSIFNRFEKFGKWLIDAFDPRSQRMKLFIFSIAGVMVLTIVALVFKVLIAAVGIVIVGSVVMFGLSFVLLLFADKLVVLLDKYFAMSAKENDYGHITELLCPKEEDNLRPNYKYIPKKQRTVRLWYRDLKNKVCKPMQS